MVGLKLSSLDGPPLGQRSESLLLFFVYFYGSEGALVMNNEKPDVMHVSKRTVVAHFLRICSPTLLKRPPSRAKWTVEHFTRARNNIYPIATILKLV